jgi:surface antigen
MRKFLPMLVVSLVTLVAVASFSQARPADDTIKKVMKAAMKGGLCKKVADGKASDDEKKQLLELFQNLAKSTPPEGDADSWKEKTSALVDAAQGAVDGDAGANAKLKKAANCMACHKVHKGK